MKNEQVPEMDDPVPQLLSTLPARFICDRLVNHYLQTFELIYRCFHIPTFWAEYEQYFSQPQPVVTNFVIKLCLVLAIGSIFSNDDDKVLQRSRRTWIQAAQYWMVGPRPFTVAVGKWSTSGDYGYGPAPRSTTVFPVSFSSRDTKEALENSPRARNPWFNGLFHPFLSSNDFDDHMPLNASDADLDSASKQSPSPQPLTSYTESSIQILMRQSLPIRLEVVRAVQNERLEHSYEMAIELATKLQTVCRTLASYCRSHWS
ncbi:hypothetical protein N7495_009963 [Penicillium taxi]|uniref:uncharacterized protein n=1 Tax=Penicillium taxi TaxID=168475 RepID=UPI0025454E97|nr:uncharacterized protein N7495_009963 [Penicillium taxi]KAJ5885453.1 hypothetical protein N7495_009963 [Penicillium taxi]